MKGYKKSIYESSDGYIVFFDDIPEIRINVKNLNDKKITNELFSTIESYRKKHKLIPMPIEYSVEEKSQYVEIPLSIESKIMLINTMIEKNIKPKYLAEKMNLIPQKINRLIHFDFNTKIDTIQEALNILGKTLEISIK